MTRAVTRTPFHSSQLIRTLADLSTLDATGSGTLIAERLGQWVGFADAIHLHGVHSAGGIDPQSARLPSRQKSDILSVDAIADVQAKLAALIRTSFASNSVLFTDETSSYASIRRFYMACQRDLELQVQNLRTRARGQMAQDSHSLRQLAVLDEVFEGIVADHEKKLLAAVPALMELRFKQLRTASLQPKEWLARFSRDLQSVLLAEMELRLQPTLGLLEALHSQKKSHT